MNKYIKQMGWMIGAIVIILLSFHLLSQMNDAKSYSYQMEEISLTENSGAVYRDKTIYIDESSDYNGRFAETPATVLNKGNYILKIDYHTTYAKNVLVQASNAVVFEVELPAEQDSIEIPVELPDNTTRCKVKFDYINGGEFSVSGITWYSDKMMYTDAVYYLFLLLIVTIALVIIYINRMRIKISREQVMIAGILGLSVLIVSLPYFEPNLRFTCDIRAHLLRIEGLREGLLDHQFPVVINPNYNNEYGQIGTSYPGLFLYLFAPLRLLNVSIVGVYKTFMVVVNILTVVIAYFSVKHITESRKAALLVSLLWCFDYFRLGVMNHAGQAVGMGIAMAFIPMLLAGIYDILFNEGKKWYFLAAGISAAIVSHVWTAIFGALVILIICIVFLKKLLHKQVLIAFMKAVGLSVLFSLSTIVSFLFSLRMNLNLEELILEDFYGTLLTVSKIWEDTNAITPIAFFILAAICFVTGRKHKDDMYHFTLVLTLCAMGFFVMATRLFPWEMLCKFSLFAAFRDFMQYAMRFYSIIDPLLIMAVGIGVTRNEKLKTNRLIYMVMIIFCSINLVWSFYRMNACIPLFTSPITGDINSKNQDDYLPAGTEPDFYGNSWPRVSDDAVVSINAYMKKNTKIWMTYTSMKDNEYIEPPLFFYEGYQAQLTDGSILSVEKGLENRVRICLPKGENLGVMVYYRVPKSIQISFLISVLSIIGFCGGQIWRWKYKSRKD